MRNVCSALLGDELEDTGVGVFAFGPVDELHQKWPLDMKL